MKTIYLLLKSKISFYPIISCSIKTEILPTKVSVTTIDTLNMGCLGS